jgi:hypothetical protein
MARKKKAAEVADEPDLTDDQDEEIEGQAGAGSRVAMQYPTDQQRKECRAVSVAGATYKRDGNGRFLVHRDHAPALQTAGLVFCD